MNEFKRHTGICAPIIVDNVDTDQIIPSREMSRVSKLGLGAGLFAGWRYLYDGKDKIGLNKDFVLNQKPYRNASILLGGRNFGCGSSREHAVWALRDFGIRVIIAETFGRIFRNNCARNGLLAIELTGDEIGALNAVTAADPQTRLLTIDLENAEIRDPDGRPRPFTIAESDRVMLLNGLDYIEYTLQYADQITEFKKVDREARPWAYL